MKRVARINKNLNNLPTIQPAALGEPNTIIGTSDRSATPQTFAFFGDLDVELLTEQPSQLSPLCLNKVRLNLKSVGVVGYW